MSIKLAPAKPDDRYARMYFSFVSNDDGPSIKTMTEDEAGEAAGWIEFWADDAKACRDSLKRMSGRIYVLAERREKRKKELSDDKAVQELEEFNCLTSESLAHRTKAWRLITSAGEPVDAPLTFENAKAVYSDEDHNLREVVTEFLKDRENFPLRASSSS